MNRRQFLALSAMSLAELALLDELHPLQAKPSNKRYSMVILGDTHFDAEPASVYHSHYNEPVEWLNRVQREEFARNGEMWRERCPRLLSRAASLIDKRTRMVLQMGDLVQGDCGDGQVHRQMLDDVMNHFKGALGNLPFVTVVGNHDIRGTKAKEVYHDYMPRRMSTELGQNITKTTFAFWVGRDAYIVLDFNDPDDDELERLLSETEKARYTFVVVHGALFPMDDSSCRWIYHGSEKDTEKRRHFRRLFAQRNAIVLCGHTHTTEYYDWHGDGGRITQLTMNSVWSKDELGRYEVVSQGAAEYGKFLRAQREKEGGQSAEERALFDEYRAGLQAYSLSRAAGSYKLNVSDHGVTIDFYAGDSPTVSHTFVMR